MGTETELQQGTCAKQLGEWRAVFSVRRRRKRDWNETLRLYDKTDYPADDDIGAGASGDAQSI